MSTVTHANQLTLDKELRHSYRLLLHAIAHLLLILEAHEDIALLELDEQRAQYLLDIGALAVRVPYDAHTGRVEHYLAHILLLVVLRRRRRNEDQISCESVASFAFPLSLALSVATLSSETIRYRYCRQKIQLHTHAHTLGQSAQHNWLLIATAIRTSEIFVKKPSQVKIARAVRFIDAINSPMRIERTRERNHTVHSGAKAVKCTYVHREWAKCVCVESRESENFHVGGAKGEMKSSIINLIIISSYFI